MFSAFKLLTASLATVEAPDTVLVLSAVIEFDEIALLCNTVGTHSVLSQTELILTMFL